MSESPAASPSDPPDAAAAGGSPGTAADPIAEDRERLVLEAKLKQAQAALDQRVEVLLARQAEGGEVSSPEQQAAGREDGAANPSGIGSDGVKQLVERRQQMYDQAFAELERMRELRASRSGSHVTYRRPPAVMFRQLRLSAEMAASAASTTASAVASEAVQAS